MVAWTGLDWLCDLVTRWEHKGEGKGEEMSKNVLVMKCNKNVNIPYCGECLLVNTGYCDVAGIVAKRKNIARTWLFKG